MPWIIATDIRIGVSLWQRPFQSNDPFESLCCRIPLQVRSRQNVDVRPNLLGTDISVACSLEHCQAFTHGDWHIVDHDCAEHPLANTDVHPLSRYVDVLLPTLPSNAQKMSVQQRSQPLLDGG